MHDERNQRVAREEADWDRAVLDLVISEGGRPLSVEEVAREVGDRGAAEDAIARLYGAGLVHRLEGFVFTTRAAAKAAALT